MPKLKFTGERMIPDVNKGAIFYYEHLNRYLFAAEFVKGKKVLDLGCGSGYGSKILDEAGAEKVVGVDVSKETIKYAKSKYRSRHLTYKLGNATDLIFKNDSFDMVVCFELLEHVSNDNKLIKEIKRVTSKKGLCLISTPNKFTYPTGNKFHKREYFPNEFETLLKKHFVNVKLSYQYFWLANSIIDAITQEDKGKQVQEDLTKVSSVSYIPPFTKRNGQYMVALCTDGNLIDRYSSMIFTPRVDLIDASMGIEGINKAIDKLDQIKIENKELKRILHEIQTSKFYRLWQTYCLYRDKILNK